MKLPVITRFCIPFAVLFLAITGLSYAADQALVEAAKKEGAVNVYTAFPRRFLDPIGDLFKNMYKLGNSFKVNFTRKGSGAIAQIVEAEHMVGKCNWDSVDMGDETPSYRWIDKGMLLKYQPPNIGNIREEFHDPLGYRIAGQLGLCTIAIHKKRVPEKNRPKRYTDVLEPKWKGRIALPNPADSGNGVILTRYLVDLYGWDYFRKLGKNRPLLVKGGSALEQLLLSGEIDLALFPNAFSVLERIKSGEADLEILYPEEPVAYYTQWTLIAKAAPHPNAAKLWAEFICTDKRQQYVSKHCARYMTSKNIVLDYPRPPLKFHKLDWKWIVKNKDDMCKRFIEEIQKGQHGG
jgi:iron(III) transport system substrate-binding protein